MNNPKLLLMISGAAVALMGCEEKTSSIRPEAAAEIVRAATRARDIAELERDQASRESEALRMEVSRLEGRIIVMEAKVSLAESRVSNAYKTGRAEALLDSVMAK